MPNAPPSSLRDATSPSFTDGEDLAPLSDITLTAHVSKGTYIRSLANDLGPKVESGSHLIELRRTESAPFRIEQALTMKALIERLEALCAENWPCNKL